MVLALKKARCARYAKHSALHTVDDLNTALDSYAATHKHACCCGDMCFRAPGLHAG